MAAMPHIHQVEQVLESLATIKSASPQKADLHPHWRLVSRDGSTTSVGGLPEQKKLDCPDCLAGRCGQSGCQCSADGLKSSISLDGLTGIQGTNAPSLPASNATNAAMPQAKPQLFEQVSPSPGPVNKPAQEAWEHELFRITTTPQSERTIEASVAGQQVSAENDRGADSSTSQSSGDELQEVINQWPRLPQSTRRAILALVGALSEADRA